MTCNTNYPKRPKEEDIFIDDINTLVEQNFPDYEGQLPLFKKFGTRTGGFIDTWVPTKDWKNLPEIEKWKYVAYCALYWEAQYKYWYECDEFKIYKEKVKEWAKGNPQFLTTLKIMEISEEEERSKK